MAFNSCCPFWRSSICEKSHLNDPKCTVFKFCKNCRNTNEKRMPDSKSLGFFWSPCKISCLRKVRLVQKWAWSDPDWRVFSVFWVIHGFDKKSSNKTYAFYHWKGKFKALLNLPWKPQVKTLPRSWIMAWIITRGIEYTILHFSGAYNPNMSAACKKVMIFPAQGFPRFLAGS